MITESELIDKLKKGFTGSDDYLSGVNDGMFTLINHLTDQIKSMEGQVKELRETIKRREDGKANLLSELESLQKENAELKSLHEEEPLTRDEIISWLKEQKNQYGTIKASFETDTFYADVCLETDGYLHLCGDISEQYEFEELTYLQFVSNNPLTN